MVISTLALAKKKLNFLETYNLSNSGNSEIDNEKKRQIRISNSERRLIPAGILNIQLGRQPKTCLNTNCGRFSLFPLA